MSEPHEAALIKLAVSPPFFLPPHPFLSLPFIFISLSSFHIFSLHPFIFLSLLPFSSLFIVHSSYEHKFRKMMIAEKRVLCIKSSWVSHPTPFSHFSLALLSCSLSLFLSLRSPLQRQTQTGSCPFIHCVWIHFVQYTYWKEKKRGESKRWKEKRSGSRLLVSLFLFLSFFLSKSCLVPILCLVIIIVVVIILLLIRKEGRKEDEGQRERERGRGKRGEMSSNEREREKGAKNILHSQRLLTNLWFTLLPPLLLALCDCGLPFPLSCPSISLLSFSSFYSLSLSPSLLEVFSPPFSPRKNGGNLTLHIS